MSMLYELYESYISVSPLHLYHFMFLNMILIYILEKLNTQEKCLYYSYINC